MSWTDRMYRDALMQIMATGQTLTTRNATCKRLTGLTFHYTETPLVSLRRTAWKTCLREFEWFMGGINDVNLLHESVQPWWSPWVNKYGYIANSYPGQFRSAGAEFPGEEPELPMVDQVEYLVECLRAHPGSRRALATTWNAQDMVVDPATKITNCHGTVIQCFVNERDEVDMVHYQRSCDMVCGYPHNALQYYAFLMWLAARAGREVGTLTHIIGDAHIYKAHWPLVEEMLAAKAPALTPQLVYTPTNREVFRADDWSLSAPYEPVINTKAELVV